MEIYWSYLWHGINNLIKYFKIIWYDRDWDHEYIQIILLFKLKNTKKDLEKYLDCDDLAYYKALNICISILERQTNEFYYKLNNFNEEIEERDLKLFGKLYSKYVRYWWT